jgi:hypothetical protein
MNDPISTINRWSFIFSIAGAIVGALVGVSNFNSEAAQFFGGGLVLMFSTVGYAFVSALTGWVLGMIIGTVVYLSEGHSDSRRVNLKTRSQGEKAAEKPD